MKASTLRAIILPVAFLLTVVGAAGFLLPVAASLGRLPIPPTFEWPAWTRPYWLPFQSPAVAWLMTLSGVVLFLGVSSGLSLASKRSLGRIGIIGSQDLVSRPAYGIVGWYVVGLFMPGLLVMVTPPFLWLFLGVIVVVNARRLLTQAWGFEIAGRNVRVWLPLRPSLNTVLTPDRVIAGVAEMAVNSYLRLPTATGKGVVLPAIGTTRFRLLIDHARRLKEGTL